MINGRDGLYPLNGRLNREGYCPGKVFGDGGCKAIKFGGVLGLRSSVRLTVAAELRKVRRRTPIPERGIFIMTDMFDLSGRVAVITGGSRGIGRMIAEEFVRRGVRTYITSRKAQPCIQTAQELSELGECIALPYDLSTMDGIDAFVAEVANRETQLDILINNAGAAWTAPFDEFPESGWDKVMNINLKSVFFLTQQLAPLLRAGASPEQPAKVINIASTDGLKIPRLETYSYASSKAGLIQLTRLMGRTLVADDILVNAIAPGAFASDMNIAARDQPDMISERIPAKRIGQPDDIAGTAVYMSSRAGNYLVGATISLDGGIVNSL